MKTPAIIAAALMTFSITLADQADAQGRARGARVNDAGGVSAGQVHNNGRRAGARGVVTDGDGNAAAGGVSCARGEAGRACRAGATTVTGEGAVNHRSGAAVEGANGASAVTQGGFTRTQDGVVTGQRDTTLTDAEGNARSATTTYDSASGITRSVTCTNASGVVVACPD